MGGGATTATLPSTGTDSALLAPSEAVVVGVAATAPSEVSFSLGKVAAADGYGDGGGYEYASESAEQPSWLTEADAFLAAPSPPRRNGWLRSSTVRWLAAMVFAAVAVLLWQMQPMPRMLAVLDVRGGGVQGSAKAGRRQGTHMMEADRGLATSSLSEWQHPLHDGSFLGWLTSPDSWAEMGLTEEQPQRVWYAAAAWEENEEA